jgi:UDP-N-acetyl-2-amino-2-deoxyglucuronate dehydrogenase
VAGYIAPRHLQALRAVGGRLVAATDPHDSVGILDKYSLDVKYFPEIERFDRPAREAASGTGRAACALREHLLAPTTCTMPTSGWPCVWGAHAICEKPLVINPWNLDALEALEQETGKRVANVLAAAGAPLAR